MLNAERQWIGAPVWHTVPHPIQRFFADAAVAWNHPGSDRDGGTGWLPSADTWEDQDAYRVAVEIPGIDPDRISLAVEDNTLVIRGTRPESAADRLPGGLTERPVGEFQRRIALPGSVDSDATTASYDRGVLTVRLPKPETSRPRQIPIEIG